MPRPSPATELLHHYVVVRRDLPIGVLAAQLVHAAGESSPGDLSPGTNAVVLAVSDEAALRAVAERLGRADIAFVRVEEPDAPYLGQLMAIGVRPAKKEVVRRALASLPLLR